MPIEQAIFLFKGGASPPKPPAPPAPTSAAENASRAIREARRKKTTGFSSSLLASYEPTSNKSILGG